MRLAEERERRRTRTRRIKSARVTIGSLLLALFPVLPIVWMVSNSFKSNSEVFERPPRLITESFSFDSFTAILGDPEKVRFFINSYVVAGLVVVLTLIVGVHAAYAFSRHQFRGKNILNIAIILTQAVPRITVLIPYFSLIVALGLFNSYPGLVLTYMVFTLPYCVVMLTGYLNTVPKELDEAVKVDGGNTMTALWRVIVPVSIPGLVSAGVYTFIIAWNEYLFALTLTKTNDMRTVPVGIELLMGQHAYEWNQIMAMSVLGSIPVIVLFVIFQRHFVSGITAGAVKA